MSVLIAPSILSADFAKLGEEVRAITSAGADWIHIDVMDGHFVPNITIGPSVIKALRPHSDLRFDVHLMIAPCDPYLADFADAGADGITVHYEAGPHIHRSLQKIRSLGKRVGIVINPGTPHHVLDTLYEELDLILVMTINPGFGGQKLIPAQLDKIRAIRDEIDRRGLAIDLQVDGGVSLTTIAPIYQAGANVMVAGTASFVGGPAQYAKNIADLRATAMGRTEE